MDEHLSPGDLDADAAVEQLYAAHWRQLVRLSGLLVHDQAAAEDVVQDAFVAMHGKWSRLRDPDKALAYLRQAVVNRSRSALRHRVVVERHARTSPAGEGAMPHRISRKYGRKAWSPGPYTGGARRMTVSMPASSSGRTASSPASFVRP